MKTFILLYCCWLVMAKGYATSLKGRQADLIEASKNGQVKFYLYTKSNKQNPQELLLNNEQSVKKSNFNKNLPTKILIHGWRGSYTTLPNPPIREAYLSKGDYNVISVDWSVYAKLNYYASQHLVSLVGGDVAAFVDFLNHKFQMKFDNLVVIGHSLGAHVAGYCGKLVKRGKLAAIVGLDPALPLFSYDNPGTRLASTDAKYVQTIQTNGNVKGFLMPLGTATFYGNWGRVQPGCGSDIIGSCSHIRCVLYYAEAVKGYSFAPIYKCKSYEEIFNMKGCSLVAEGVSIGDPLEIRQKQGIYRFVAKSEAPYGHL